MVSFKLALRTFHAWFYNLPIIQALSTLFYRLIFSSFKGFESVTAEATLKLLNVPRVYMKHLYFSLPTFNSVFWQ